MLFSGENVVLDLGSGVPFKTKKQLRDIVERNGGRIAYGLNKQASARCDSLSSCQGSEGADKEGFEASKKDSRR
jgi:hypothetical protein